MKYIVDTNVVLGTPEILEQYETIVPNIVLKEIENLELKKGNSQLQFEIRHAKRILYNMVLNGKSEMFDVVADVESLSGFSTDYADNIIIQKAKKSGYGLITNDVLMILKAKAMDIQIISPLFDKRDNTGYEGVTNFEITDGEHVYEVLAKVEESVGGNHDSEFFEKFDLSENQYVIFWETKKPIKRRNSSHVGIVEKKLEKQCRGTFKFANDKFHRINEKTSKIKSEFVNITPRNVRQMCAIDMLKDERTKIKALFGTFGAGKDYLMLGQALAMVNDPRCDVDKIVWVRNNIEVKDTNPVGFLPNDLEDKLMPFLMPLVDHLGGDKETLREMMADGKVEVQHLGFIRGRDIKNAIIYVTEVQSNTLEHIQLLIGRVGEGSQIWFNGDDQQTDSHKFELNNGVSALKKLSGQELYGQVTLDKTERSEVARLSALLDDK